MHVGRIFPWRGTVIVLAIVLAIGLAIVLMPAGQMRSSAQPVVRDNVQQQEPVGRREPPIAQLLEVSNAEPIHLRAGIARTLLLAKPVRAVIIGDPTIADATVQSEKTVVLTGKAQGTTDVILFDDKNNQMFSARIEIARAEPNVVKIHPRGGRNQLQSSFSFTCPERGVCSIVKDEPITVEQQARLLSAQNQGPLVQQNIDQQSNPPNIEQQSNPQQNTTTPSSPQTNTSQ
jgi:Flp pilus assembly secretin CpaC